MLVIAGTIRIDPTRRDELAQTAIEVAHELRKQLGCSYVAISADLEDRELLHLLQKWDSRAALSANLSSPRIFAIRNQVGRLDAAIEVTQETRKLPGCVSFAISADLEDPGVLHLGVRAIAVHRYAIQSVGPIG